jgi:hypothetical protein
MFRFTIRDLLWLMLVVGLACAFWMERRFNSAQAASRNAEKSVIQWLGKQSYAVMQSGGRHMSRPLPPTMDMKQWIEEGKQIPNIEPALRSLIVMQDTRVELPLVALALGRFGNSDSVPALIDCFASQSIHLRIQSAVALGKIGDHRAIGSLGKITVSDLDSNVRANAVSALAFIGGEESLPYIESATRDSEKFVAESAEDALEWYKHGRY